MIFDKIQETIDLGGTGILFQGGLHPDLKIEWYEDLLRAIKAKFDIWCHCFSAPEITNIAEVSGLSLRDTIARLRDAGLDSIPGGGAEILDDAVRHRISRLKCGTQEWIDVHRTAHALGMRTTATMMFGCGETIEQRMNHFDIVRQIQEDTGGFTAFIPWAFQRELTSLGRFIKEEATAVEYLKTLAISRIYLDNIREHSELVGDAGAEDLPAGAALRRQRCGQHHDRRERGVGRGDASSGDGGRAAAHDPRCGLCAEAAGHAVPHVFPELSFLN